MVSLWCLSAAAQQSGLIGTVTDSTGSVIVGARVALFNHLSGVEYSAQTNKAGVYNIEAMVPGEYELHCESSGYTRFVQTSLVLKIGLIERVDIALETSTDELVNEYENSERWMSHPSAIDKCMTDEKWSNQLPTLEIDHSTHPYFTRFNPGNQLLTLEIDYSIHPYYIRIDIDGDGATEYILSVMRGPVWKHYGLMVCHEDGSKTIYRGIADRRTVAEEENRATPRREIVKDTVLIEGQTSRVTLNSKIGKNDSLTVSDLLLYSVARCCSGQGRMGGQLIFTEDRGLRAIPLGLTWYPISQSDVLDRTSDMLRGIGEIAGEGIVTAWESATSVGFMQNGQFRWLIYMNADPD